MRIIEKARIKKIKKKKHRQTQKEGDGGNWKRGEERREEVGRGWDGRRGG